MIRRIKADTDHPVNRGIICPKGAAAAQVIHSPDRLKYPMKKTVHGFIRISWDEALDLIAQKFADIRTKYGPQTLVGCKGAPVTQAALDSLTQLIMACGSKNLVGAGHLCHLPRDIAFEATYGAMALPDYENTRCMIIWGANPTDSRQYGYGVAYGKFNRVIPEAKHRGARLIVIDPRHTDLVDSADMWLAIEPGRDDALALAMINVIIEEALYDSDFTANWITGFDQLAEHVASYTPEWAQSVTGIKATNIREVARLYATTKPASILDGNFADQYPNSVQTARAIGILCAITGNIDSKGGNVFFPGVPLSPLITGAPPVKRLGADKYPLLRGTFPFPDLIDALLSGKPYKPRAMIVHHANPALINANSSRTLQGLKELEFLVVSDIFKTATAEIADIILPETSDYERYGFRCYTSANGGFVSLRQKVIEPIGESRPIFDIEYEIAKRMGLEAVFPWKNTNEWINHRLKAAEITLDDLIEQGTIYVTPPLEYRKYLKNGFHTLSGKVEVYSRKFEEAGYPPLPVPWEPDTKMNDSPCLIEQYPLIGTTRRPGIFVHTRFRNIAPLRDIEPEPLLRINHIDAEIRGIVSGDFTTVSSQNGTITVKALVTDETSPGVVIIDFGWGNPGDNGANVNLLTSDTERDPVCGSTPNRRFRCQIAKATEQ
jgi:anaerobic selenocysteine-containing dehydrogenase